MKLSDIFKKETQKTVKSNVQTLDKKQLEKVIGGVDEIIPEGGTNRNINTTVMGPAKGK